MGCLVGLQVGAPVGERVGLGDIVGAWVGLRVKPFLVGDWVVGDREGAVVACRMGNGVENIKE